VRQHSFALYCFVNICDLEKIRLAGAWLGRDREFDGKHWDATQKHGNQERLL